MGNGGLVCWVGLDIVGIRNCNSTNGRRTQSLSFRFVTMAVEPRFMLKFVLLSDARLHLRLAVD